MGTPRDYKLMPMNPQTQPPPSPPRFLKQQIYDNPLVFKHIDDHAVSEARTNYRNFKDLVWNLVHKKEYSQLEKARAIFRWMTTKNLYTIMFDSELPGSPEQILGGFKDGKTTYARIFETLANYAGLHCVTLSGWAKGVDYRPGFPITSGPINHSWNAVNVDNNWQLVDCHWATRYLQSERNVPENLVYEYDDFYFFTDPRALIYSHCPEEVQWQLVTPAVGRGDYEDYPLVKSFFFSVGMQFLQQNQGIVYTKNGLFVMTLGFVKPTAFTFKLAFGDNMIESIQGIQLKRYVIQETTENRVSFYFRAPREGNYYLTIFAQHVGERIKVENIFKAACEFKIICETAAGDTRPYPLCSDSNWGPGAPVRQYGLIAAHLDAILLAPKGRAEVAFQKTRDVRLFARLSKDGLDEDTAERCVQVREQDDMIYVTTSLPAQGEYGLEIYANEPAKEGDTFTHMCQYLCSSREGDASTNYGQVYDRADFALHQPQGTLMYKGTGEFYGSLAGGQYRKGPGGPGAPGSQQYDRANTLNQQGVPGGGQYMGGPGQYGSMGPGGTQTRAGPGGPGLYGQQYNNQDSLGRGQAGPGGQYGGGGSPYGTQERGQAGPGGQYGGPGQQGSPYGTAERVKVGQGQYGGQRGPGGPGGPAGGSPYGSMGRGGPGGQYSPAGGPPGSQQYDLTNQANRPGGGPAGQYQGGPGQYGTAPGGKQMYQPAGEDVDGKLNAGVAGMTVNGGTVGYGVKGQDQTRPGERGYGQDDQRPGAGRPGETPYGQKAGGGKPGEIPYGQKPGGGRPGEPGYGQTPGTEQKQTSVNVQGEPAYHFGDKGGDPSAVQFTPSRPTEPEEEYQPHAQKVYTSTITVAPPTSFRPIPIQEQQPAPKPAPPPVPPKPFKDTKIFQAVDTHAVAVAREEHRSFKDLVWHLIYAREITNELEKARAIFLWLCSKDLTKLQFTDVDKGSPEEILMSLQRSQTTYAVVYETLCSYAGLHCKTISGYAKGAEYKPGMKFTGEQGQHSWNSVLVNGAWRLVDCHWAARRLVGKKVTAENVRYELDEYYFMPDPHQLIFTHFPDDANWQLLDRQISLSDFENLVPVKSAFFKYGLQILSHREAVIETVREVVIRVGCPPNKAGSLAFTFTLTYDDGREEFQGTKLNRFGMQEMVDNVSYFTIRPPDRGSYRLIIFAKDLTLVSREGVYGGVCGYEVICQVAPQAPTPFPPCVHTSWGPGDSASKYSLEPLQKGAIFSTVNGQAEVKFRLPKELRFTGKLKSNGQDEKTLSQFIMHRIVGDVAIFSISAPANGEYGLEIYANDPEKDGNSLFHAYQYLLAARDVQGPVIPLPVLPPGYLGPQASFKKLGLSCISHQDSYIINDRDEVQISFEMAQPLRMTSQLLSVGQSSQEDASDYILQQGRGNQVIFQIRFPRGGMYKLQIYALPYTDTSESLPGVYNYLINCSGSYATLVPYPRQYGQWKEGCYLHEPQEGQIGKNRPNKGSAVSFDDLYFKIDVPKANSVAVVVNEDWTQLEQKGGTSWEAEVKMGPHWGREPKVAVCANYGGVKASYSTLLEYVIQ